MKRIIGNIYEEDNYDVFRRLPDNRDVLTDRVNKLVASISEKYICNPIIVNEKMEVVDGQGRFEARKELGLPIHYIIAEGANSDDCRRMNKYNTKWSILDFAKSYSKQGKPSYINLLEACEKTKLPVGIVLRLANHAKADKGRSVIMTNFEKGKLDFSKTDIGVVARVTEMASEIVDALQYEGRINDAFRIGVKIMVETKGYDHARMLRNCIASRSSYAQMSRICDQLVEFERIYNKRCKRKLFFSDALRNFGSNVRDYDTCSRHQYDGTDVSTLTNG